MLTFSRRDVVVKYLNQELIGAHFCNGFTSIDVQYIHANIQTALVTLFA